MKAIQEPFKKVIDSNIWIKEEALISFLMLDYYKNCHLETKKVHGEQRMMIVRDEEEAEERDVPAEDKEKQKVSYDRF